jgi:hypothetical protein
MLQCYLDQDYEGVKHLVILDDSDSKLKVGDLGKDITYLREGPFNTLGDKRQRLFDYSIQNWEDPIIVHMDDDDLYLPYHLSTCVDLLQDFGCVKCGKAWKILGKYPLIEVKGPGSNNYEGSMAFHAHTALELGGYLRKDVGEAKGILYGARDAKDLGKTPVEFEKISYVYRWGQGVRNVSTTIDCEDGLQIFRKENRDFGLGRELRPSPVAKYWAAIEKYRTKIAS